jgi:carbon monoxide dehydrogenase subunit G
VAEYHATIETTENQADAFEYLATFSNAADWDPGVASGQPLQAGPPEVGSVYRLRIPLARWKATFDYRIVEIERPLRVVLRADHSLVRSIDTITVEPRAQGSVVKYEAVLEPRGVFRLLSPLVAQQFRAIADRAADGLRAALR